MSINRILSTNSATYFGRNLLTSRHNSIENKRLLSKMTSISDIIAKNKQSEELITSMQSELHAMQQHMIAKKKQTLLKENELLRKQVEDARFQLLALMKGNGKAIISVPGARTLCTEAKPGAATAESNQTPAAAAVDPKAAKASAPKEGKPKKEKPAAAAAAANAAPELPIDVGRLDLRIGKIVEVTRHPDADSLYVEKIDCGEAQPRTIVSGLVKHVPIEEMQNRLVVVLCNLKPAKMRGITSEGMVMCASTPEKVELLTPPAGAVAGDLVSCEGYERHPDAQMNPKKKIFETVAPDLKTNADLVATYKGAALFVPGKDRLTAPSLAGAHVK